MIQNEDLLSARSFQLIRGFRKACNYSRLDTTVVGATQNLEETLVSPGWVP